MSDLTQSQVTAIQGLTTNVDLAYRTLMRSRTALSFLIGHGQATCNDVKTYNAMVQSTYFYQKGVADIIRAQGGTAPQVQPPVYVAWAGKTGDAAIDINCEAGGLHGWRPVAGALGDFYIDPAKVEWKQEPTPNDTASIAKFVALAGSRKQPANNNGQLGNPALLLALIPLVLWGIIIYVAGHIILSIVEALTDVPGKQEYTRQVAISAERHAAVLEARQKCLADCLARPNANQETCSKNCARLITEYKPPAPNEPMVILGKVVIGVVAIGAVVVGIGLFRHYLGPGSGGGGGSGPAGGHDDEELDGPHGYADEEQDDDDEDDSAIDAEYTEHVGTSHQLEA